MMPSTTNSTVQGQPQSQANLSGLASLFQNNVPAASTTGGGQALPQIMAPQRPVIAPPPQARPLPAPVQQQGMAGLRPQMPDFGSQGGQGGGRWGPGGWAREKQWKAMQQANIGPFKNR